jgi:CheY-like chemotaxis protein
MQSGAGLEGKMGQTTILFVDDSADIRNLMCPILRSRGYMVIEAGDGIAALDAACHFEGFIDVLITDIEMPRMGGIELCTQLRRERPATRVIFISGRAIPKDGVNGEFFPKPFTPIALEKKIRGLLELGLTGLPSKGISSARASVLALTD